MRTDVRFLLVQIFLSVRVVPINHVQEEDRYSVNKVRSIPGFYGVTYMKVRALHAKRPFASN